MRSNLGSRIIPSFIALLMLSISCSKPTDETQPQTDLYLQQSSKIASYSTLQLEALVALAGFSVPQIKYGVDVYKVVYKTNYNGNQILASGLVILPQTNNVGMIAIQHGTIVVNGDAPTSLSTTDSEMILYAVSSSLGFIAVVPDFLGFGSSSQIFHPYYLEDLYSSDITNILRAAKELASSQKIQFNQKLFLAGYSEGGYATMAAHKYIQQNGLDGFNLLASFPAAGGYDVKDVQEYLFGLGSYPNPYFAGYVAMSYRTTLGWTQPLTDFFNEPYADEMPSLFNKINSSDQIDAALTDSIPLLINKNLRDSIETSNHFSYIKSALIANSLTDWTPTIKMFMYHGDADTTVPYQSSVDTYNKLIGNGATTDNLKLITLPGANHFTGLQPYAEDVLSKVLEINNGSL